MAGMTRKDFQAIADVLKDLKPAKTEDIGTGYTAEFRMWQNTVKEFTNMCAGQNGRFDRDRFQRACDFED